MTAQAIPVHIAVEDALSESVLRALLKQSRRPYCVGSVYGLRGFGDLKRMAPGFNQAAPYTPFILLTDLDEHACVPQIHSRWLAHPRHSNFLFRVAVREVESWVLADRKSFAKFCGVPVDLVTERPDELPDPKAALVRIANRSRYRRLREDLCPPAGSIRVQGPGYNARLAEFVACKWDAVRAAAHSPSLARSFQRIREFNPKPIAQEE